MNGSVVVEPDCRFDALDRGLTSLGFQRDLSVRAVTPEVLPGEPELAAWTMVGGGRLTYTLNPVVMLRVLTGSALDDGTAARLAGRLPLLDGAAVARLLSHPDRRRVLLGLFAARALGAAELADLIAPLRSSPDQLISAAAASALEAIETGRGATVRRDALDILQALCREAIPVLAALVGRESDTTLESLRPRPDDAACAFAPEIADAVRNAYEIVWASPPSLERLTSGELKLRVDAAPAGMLREDNELSRHFPGGYRGLAPYLQSHRIWFVWRYLRGASAGMRYDGIVRLDDRWVWFPKPYRVVGEIVGEAKA